MADFEKYSKLKQRVEEAQDQANRAEGALSQIMKQLKEEFDCDTLEQAKKLLEQLEQQERAAQKRFDRALEEFENKWSEKL